ncbi:MAG TPA: hypothetical protein VFD77_08580 [Brumimicrobium sp.]|nr:hypothetical protein [Brumimicrobium sp.]
MLLQILKKSSFLLCAGAILIFTSCKGDESESIDAEKETVTETPRSLPNMNPSENQGVEASTTKGAENEDFQNLPINMNAGSQSGAKLNPAHGEPGHDCAVPVGQPLPSAGGTDLPVVNQPSSKKAVVLNPAHGEPGHDCAVPVGQPLN